MKLNQAVWVSSVLILAGVSSLSAQIVPGSAAKGIVKAGQVATETAKVGSETMQTIGKGSALINSGLESAAAMSAEDQAAIRQALAAQAAADQRRRLATMQSTATPATGETAGTPEGLQPSSTIATHFGIPTQVPQPLTTEAANTESVGSSAVAMPDTPAGQQLARKRTLAKLYRKAQLSGSSDYVLERMKAAIIPNPNKPVFAQDAFESAFYDDDFAAMDFWLEFGEVDINAPITRGSEWAQKEETTLLKIAVEKQDLEAVKYLVDKGADVSTLHWLPLEFSYDLSAIKDIVIYIIDHGGAKAVDEEGVSLLDRISVDAGPTIPILQHLYDNGVDITKKFYYRDLLDEGIVLKK